MRPGSGILIGRIFGIPIYLHGSWFLIFGLITLSLATQFKALHPTWSTGQHWAVGIVASLLFFGSVLFHELGHSFVALRYRIPVVSITLFVFGGLAQIRREPDSAKQEFNIAVAGPVASFSLAACFFLIEKAALGNGMVATTAKWLGWMNFLLGAFNLLPGFPLDGGRILRAIVWGATKDFTRATRFASRGGQLFAYLMIIYGIWEAVKGEWWDGIWLAFIGWFLLTAAQESYAHIAIRMSLSGLRAGDVMTQELPMVPRDMSLEEYVHEVLRTGRRCHIVGDHEKLAGLITLHAVQRFPREEWSNTSVQAAMLSPSAIHWAKSEEPVLSVLERMQQEDINQMPVMQDGRLVGMIARDSILRVLQTRLQASHLAEQ